jgi:hypothetical protein
MSWQIRTGVLAAPGADRPGSSMRILVTLSALPQPRPALADLRALTSAADPSSGAPSRRSVTACWRGANDSHHSAQAQVGGMAVPGARVSRGPLPQSGTALRASIARKMPGPMHLLYSVCHSNATHQRLGIRLYIRKILITWSLLTESNRRPSPYHEPPNGSVAAGRAGDQAEHKHRPALTSPRQALTSVICPSICPSV